MNLSEVSKTAIMTLTARMVGTEKQLLEDPKAVECYNTMLQSATGKEQAWMKRLKRRHKGLTDRISKDLCYRVKRFDQITNDFIEKHPSCTVINLACGFDTRYWRIDYDHCDYYELDFPEVIQLKTELLGDQINYNMIASSALDLKWIDEIMKNGNENVLILAEGLFMYLKEDEVNTLLTALSKKLNNSTLVFDSSLEKYTKGIWKKLVQLKWRVSYRINTEFVSGIKNPVSIENSTSGIEVIHAEKTVVGQLITVSINKNN